MFVYECQEPIPPEEKANGRIRRCNMGDLGELVQMSNMFHLEIGINQKDIAEYRKDMIEEINSGNIFFWEDENEKTVASCKYRCSGNMACIGFVFVYPNSRRRHYAETLVYEVTIRAKEEGYTPMLYADADYIPSNACYRKIGYVLRGRICTVR